ncbi:NAD(P)H-dependent oxidoreductase [Streptomyces koelreuteriae]|uniref:NAD(P)H-dependent oxidoreductase n=1 Tax=Streptomyces koelreuteriae TaxID=2838015 RepID=UPI003EC14EF4
MSVGVGYARPTRLLVDRVAVAVCRSLAAGGARAEVEVLELHRLTVDLAQHFAQGRVGLDLREAIAEVVAADGLVVATPVLAASPSEVFDSFFAVLGDASALRHAGAAGAQQRLPLAAPDLAQVIRGRLTGVYATSCPRSSSRAPPTGGPRLTATRRGCTPASAKAPPNSPAVMRSHRR